LFFNWDMPGLHGNGRGLAESSRNMSAFWTRFARTGQPSAPGQLAWVRYDTTRRATMLIDTQCRLADDPNAGERRLWQALD
jgi:para-nitrobenzyl esterase